MPTSSRCRPLRRGEGAHLCARGSFRVKYCADEPESKCEGLMYLSRRLGLITAALLLSGVTVGIAQQPAGRVRGQVLDGSYGVVPGATVEAAVAGRVVATTVTD